MAIFSAVHAAAFAKTWERGQKPRDQGFGGVSLYFGGKVSKTYRRQSNHTPRIMDEKRPKEQFRAEIEEELRLIRSPLRKWEQERRKNAV